MGDKTQNASFEVPLYVTTAAIGKKADLKTPTEYDSEGVMSND